MKKRISIIILLCLIMLIFVGCNQNADEPAEKLGVWWWDCELNVEQYMGFAKQNGVSEIYYCDSRFDENAASFISSAKNIKVFWLAGEYQWLRDPAPLYRKIDKYAAYQSENPDSRFCGIHLDIEPHQDPNFSTEREFLLKSLISLAHDLSETYPNIDFEYDIPFWLDDEIEFGGKTQPAYAHIIDNAARVCIMSYRDTAEAIYKTAKDEVEYAVSVGKTLVLGVETRSSEGDSVSFMEEGKEYMYGEIAKLRQMIPSGFGVAVHHVKTWYDLQD